jgi:hypothetical protein
VVGSMTGIRPSMTHWRGAGGGELGEDGSDRWAPSAIDGGAVMGGRTAHARS